LFGVEFVREREKMLGIGLDDEEGWQLLFLDNDTSLNINSRSENSESGLNRL
jgi:hypothetical protein